MPNPLSPALLLLLAAPAPAVPREGDEWQMAQLMIRQRIVIRVQQEPMASRAPIPVPPLPKLRLEEKKGPKCIPIAKLAGSGIARKDSVDLLLSDGTLLRAKLGDDCPSLDFYAGLYLRQTVDGQLCGDRDIIRARSGRACPISSFKKLKQQK